MEVSLPDTLAGDADQRVAFHGVPWSHYEIMLAIKGDAPTPRVAYLQGELELMSPSRSHEEMKSRIRQLVEVYRDYAKLDLNTYGSWTLRSAPNERGVEPDECFILGDTSKIRPDLAIEVVWTHGGLDKLEIYRGLAVPEVWQWKAHRIEVYVLRADAGYEQRDRSELLPGLDLALLCKFAQYDSQGKASREFRDALMSNKDK